MRRNGAREDELVLTPQFAIDASPGADEAVGVLAPLEGRHAHDERSSQHRHGSTRLRERVTRRWRGR